MRNVTIGVVSFVLGVCCAGLLGSFNPQTSIARHFFDGGTVFAQKRLVALPPIPSPLPLNSSTPIVPVPPRFVSEDSIYELQIVQFDGRTSVKDTFRNSVLIYGGGAYHLEKARLDGDIQVVLVGAAANTAQFMQTFGMIGCPTAKPSGPPPVNPNTPRVETTTLTSPISGDLLSPYSGTK